MGPHLRLHWYKIVGTTHKILKAGLFFKDQNDIKKTMGR